MFYTLNQGIIKARWKEGSLLINILLCDDHAVVRSGLKVLLNNHPDFNVVGEAAEGNEGIQKALELRPDVVIMDLSMPKGKDGLTATLELKKKAPEIIILILTMHEDEGYLFRAIQAGASGSILKSAPHEELVSAIRAVYNGDTYLFPNATKKLVKEYLASVEEGNTDTFELLSDREKEVLTLIAKGFPNKDIGEKLFISVKTVESHRSNLMGKLEMRTRPELVTLALKKGLIGYGI